MRLDIPGVRLDTSARALGVVVAVLWLGAARAETLDGVQMPDRTSKVGERRYRVPQDWENTLKYFKTVYPTGSYPRRTIVHQPGVKAVHIANPDGKGWEGLNVYEANDEVRVYVVPPEGVPAKPVKKKAPAKKSS